MAPKERPASLKRVSLSVLVQSLFQHLVSAPRTPVVMETTATLVHGIRSAAHLWEFPFYWFSGAFILSLHFKQTLNVIL